MTNITLSALVFGLGYVTALYKLSLLLLLLLLRLLNLALMWNEIFLNSPAIVGEEL